MDNLSQAKAILAPLPIEDVVTMTFAGLLLLTPAEAELTFIHVMNIFRRHPKPSLMYPMLEARDWAEWATVQDRKAYALAGFEALSPADQAAFLAHVAPQQRGIAA